VAQFSSFGVYRAQKWAQFDDCITLEKMGECNLLIELAPQVGLEPTTLRLTDCPGKTTLSCLDSVSYSVFTSRLTPYGLIQSVNYFNSFNGG